MRGYRENSWDRCYPKEHPELCSLTLGIQELPVCQAGSRLEAPGEGLAKEHELMLSPEEALKLGWNLLGVGGDWRVTKSGRCGPASLGLSVLSLLSVPLPLGLCVTSSLAT